MLRNSGDRRNGWIHTYVHANTYSNGRIKWSETNPSESIVKQIIFSFNFFLFDITYRKLYTIFTMFICFTTMYPTLLPYPGILSGTTTSHAFCSLHQHFCWTQLRSEVLYLSLQYYIYHYTKNGNWRVV